jgi:hypothetical protein
MSMNGALSSAGQAGQSANLEHGPNPSFPLFPSVKTTSMSPFFVPSWLRVRMKDDVLANPE